MFGVEIFRVQDAGAGTSMAPQGSRFKIQGLPSTAGSTSAVKEHMVPRRAQRGC